MRTYQLQLVRAGVPCAADAADIGPLLAFACSAELQKRIPSHWIMFGTVHQRRVPHARDDTLRSEPQLTGARLENACHRV
jgi:hypothetical protein